MTTLLEKLAGCGLEVDEAPASIPERLAAKLAQGEMPAGLVLNCICAIELVRDELADALSGETGRREAVQSASEHLAGIACTLHRAVRQLEGKP